MSNNIKIEVWLNSSNKFYENIKDKLNYLIIDKDIESLQQIFIVTVKNLDNKIYEFAIFNASSNLPPKILEKNEKIYVACNSKVTIIDLNNFKIVKTIKTETYVNEVLENKKNDLLIIISMAEVECIDLYGTRIWHKDIYFIKSYYIEENYIIIETNEKIQKLDIEDGNTVFEEVLFNREGKGKKYICPICGYDGLNEPAWLGDGIGSSFEICPCCGTEFGYEDCKPEGKKRQYEQWVARKYEWHFPQDKPKDWDLDKQLKNINKAR